MQWYSKKVLVLAGWLVLLAVTGCGPRPDAAQRESEARDLFNRTVRDFHLPSAEAKGPERTSLLEKAASGYAEVVAQYGDVARWASQAERSLGNVRAEQGNIDEAVRLYDRVVARYPGQEWEVLQSLKSAADLLWDHGKPGPAGAHYQQIVTRFDRPDQMSVVKIIVSSARKRIPSPSKGAG